MQVRFCKNLACHVMSCHAFLLIAICNSCCILLNTCYAILIPLYGSYGVWNVMVAGTVLSTIGKPCRVVPCRAVDDD